MAGEVRKKNSERCGADAQTGKLRQFLGFGRAQQSVAYRAF
jgi:hypothetical protein